MTELVTVGCKIPSGLVLEMGRAGDENYKSVTIHGANCTHGASPVGRITGKPVAVVGGYGITPNVPKDFMDAWMKKNERMPAVVNGLIFVELEPASAVDAAETFAELKTGYEPLDADVPGDELAPTEDQVKELAKLKKAG